MSGGKIPRYIEQSADAEAMAAAIKTANRFPVEEVLVLRLADRVERLEQRVMELERDRPVFGP